jgi:hypothetical protein
MFVATKIFAIDEKRLAFGQMYATLETPHHVLVHEWRRMFVAPNTGVTSPLQQGEDEPRGDGQQQQF